VKAVKTIVGVVAIVAAAALVYFVVGAHRTADLNNRAMGLIEQSRFAEARDLLEQASRRNPNNPVIWRNLGTAYEGLREPAKAVQAYERSLALRPDQTELRAELAALKKLLELEAKK